MNDLGTRPDDDLVELLGRTMRAVAEAAPDWPIDAHHDRHRWMMVAAAVAVVGVAGAGLAVRSANEPQQLPPLDPNDRRPTVESFGPTLEEDRLLYDAQDRMLRDCMASAGQIWNLTGFDRFGGDLDPLWELIGRTDLDKAETIGYNPFSADTFDESGSSTVAESPAWEVAFYGGTGADLPSMTIVDPVTGAEPRGGPMEQFNGGCWGAAQAMLYADQSRYTSLSTYIANEISRDQWSGPLDDPRIDGPIRAWSDCIVDHGHARYALPTDPGNEAGRRNADADQHWQPSADEIALAVDDVGCKQSSGLIDITQQLLDAYGRRAAATALPLLDEYGQIVDHGVAQANGYLRGTLELPWRSAPSDDAPHNTEQCVWLPDDPASLDMSVSERFELMTYLNAVGQVEHPLPEAMSVPVPPWLLADSTCTSEVTTALVDSVQAAIVA
jgi:hypothetical protein